MAELLDLDGDEGAPGLAQSPGLPDARMSGRGPELEDAGVAFLEDEVIEEPAVGRGDVLLAPLVLLGVEELADPFVEALGRGGRLSEGEIGQDRAEQEEEDGGDFHPGLPESMIGEPPGDVKPGTGRERSLRSDHQKPGGATRSQASERYLQRTLFSRYSRRGAGELAAYPELSRIVELPENWSRTKKEGLSRVGQSLFNGALLLDLWAFRHGLLDLLDQVFVLLRGEAFVLGGHRLDQLDGLLRGLEGLVVLLQLEQDLAQGEVVESSRT